MIFNSDKETIIVEPPVKAKPEVDIDILEKIQPGSLEDSYVYVHCRCHNAGDDLLVRIWRSTFLIDQTSSDKSQMIHAENITIAPQWTIVPRNSTHNFLLVFCSLPSTCKVFDLVEQIPQPGGFEVRGIRRNESDVYRISIL
ncbi:MAG: hypothetical protein R2820_06020 [Cyclobacteriaceae bacterium]